MQRRERMQNSKKLKDDEYYTLFQDVADELVNYKDYFQGKRVLCPCDGEDFLNEEIVYKAEGIAINRPLHGKEQEILPSYLSQTASYEMELGSIKSQFVYYLLSQAEDWGIQTISVSGYNPMTREGVKFQDINYEYYDIVVTNPPFSIFGDFIQTLLDNQVGFVVIGPLLGTTLKGISRFFRTDQLRFGYHYHMSGFRRPDGTILPKQDLICRSCLWYTNLPVDLSNKELILSYSYEETPELFPKYHNYDAIEVPKTKMIPYDYYGPMGVPPSFLEKYNPQQFDIIGESSELAEKFVDHNGKKCSGRFYLEKPDGTLKRLQSRYVIQRRKQ